MSEKADINQLLHDADQAVMGSEFARSMRHFDVALRLENKAVSLYRAALKADPNGLDPAWDEDGNRDHEWIKRHNLEPLFPRPQS